MTRDLKGIPGAPGLARGLAFQWKESPILTPSRIPTDPKSEKARLAEARQQAEYQLHELSAQISHQLGEAESALFEAQAMFLNDPVLVEKAESAIDAGNNAEQAWHEASEFFAAQLETLTDETLRSRSADIRDVGLRVIEILLGTGSKPMPAGQTILLARDLTPSQTASIDSSKVLAFCTIEGGPTSHTAILAKALGIPAVVGIGSKLMEIDDGTLLLVDGTAGSVASNPTLQLLAEFDQRIEAESRQHEREVESASQPAITIDGHRVEIAANAGNMEDARKALKYGAEGIGLLRTEFLFINRNKPPDEQTQFLAYRSIFELMQTRPVVVRTLDVGGDKEVPYFDFGVEANPFLGYRAIRISLDHPADFKSQLRALLRAGTGHDLRLMFPMIATLDEVRASKEILEEAAHELILNGIAPAEKFQVGIMVEVPSAALLADKFAPEVDFFSIGTNDLTQYTFAAERGNKRVSHLNDPCHPAILRLIERVTQAAHAHGRWVGVCGEMGGDQDAVPLLLGLGVDELSMSPSRIPHIKQIIRALPMARARAAAAKALELETAEEVRRLVKM